LPFIAPLLALRSGVNPNIFLEGDRGAEGDEEGGVHWGGVWGKGTAPSPEIFLDFGSQNGDLWCIPGAIFCSSAKTLRGRKDTLARVYFYWGQSNPSPLAPRNAGGTSLIFQ